MIIEVWGEDNWMVDQVRPNAVTCHPWAPQYSALVSKARDEHWGSEFLVTFNSEGRIYDMSDKFQSHLAIISFNWFWSIQPHTGNLKLFTHLICQPLINKGIPSGASVNKKFQMQAGRITSNSAICQQRLSGPNIKQILNKRNKRDIKWHFGLHSVFYEAWGFFEMSRSSSEGPSSSLLLEYCASKSWWESWSSSRESTSLIWAGLLAWGFVQSLLKWPGSPHLQHPSEHVGTAACQMGSNDLVMRGLAAGRVKAFWLIRWQCLSHQVMSDATSW